MSQTYVAQAQKDAGTLTVSHPHDPAERQADQAADIVARGGSVAGWSFASVRAGCPSIHRDEASPRQPTDADKYKAGAKKVGEALLETKAGKELIQKVEDTEPVKAIKKGLDTTAGKFIAGGVIAAGAGGLAAAKQPFPVQLPEIKIAPGVSVGVHVEGPLNNPTSGGITLTFKDQGGSGKKGPTESDKIADETRRLRASTEMFKSAQQKAQEQADERAIVAAMFARSAQFKPVIPLAPGAKPYISEAPTEDKPAADEPKEDAAQPVQREAVSAAPSLDTSGVESVTRGGGRPLDADVRRSMETRFGYDFSAVRVHDDAQGHAAADGVQANAFTVGDHIGFSAGHHPAYSTREGRHLLAHELAHVVQQRAQPTQRFESYGRRSGGGAAVHRVGLFESVARFFGGGTFSNDELQAYLDLIRKQKAIEDNYDSDNKARDIVRRFTAKEPRFSILTVPDRVLLIKELLEGYVASDDESAILDLLNEAIPQERAAIVKQVGEKTLTASFSGDNRKRLRDTIEDADETLALQSKSGWTVDGVLDVLERQGDVFVVRDLERLKYKIIRFDTAFDKWKYKKDGSVKEEEVKGLRGNTDIEKHEIRLRASLTDDEVAKTLFHESRHAVAYSGPKEPDYLEDEIAARVATEEFSIRHGFPPSRPGYRRADGSVDVDFIRKEINASPHYNPTNRKRLSRRYVGEKVVPGWRVRPTPTGRQGKRP